MPHMKITEFSYGARKKPPQRFIIQNSAAAGSAVGGLPACALGPLVSLACSARVRVVRGARKPVLGPKQWRKPSDFPAARLESPWGPSRSAPTPVGSQNAPSQDFEPSGPPGTCRAPWAPWGPGKKSGSDLGGTFGGIWGYFGCILGICGVFLVYFGRTLRDLEKCRVGVRLSLSPSTPTRQVFQDAKTSAGPCRPTRMPKFCQSCAIQDAPTNREAFFRI